MPKFKIKWPKFRAPRVRAPRINAPKVNVSAILFGKNPKPFRAPKFKIRAPQVSAPKVVIPKVDIRRALFGGGQPIVRRESPFAARKALGKGGFTMPMRFKKAIGDFSKSFGEKELEFKKDVFKHKKETEFPAKLEELRLEQAKIELGTKTMQERMKEAALRPQLERMRQETARIPKRIVRVEDISERKAATLFKLEASKGQTAFGIAQLKQQAPIQKPQPSPKPVATPITESIVKPIKSGKISKRPLVPSDFGGAS